jgi:CO/xanthine dehydrogenase FAD-binding subunit
MKPAPFAYHAPTTIDEALAILGQDLDGSRLLAGGQSLAPMLNLRLASFDNLIDLNCIAGLDHIRIESGGIVIGALARQYDVAHNDDVRSRLPVLSTALGHVAHTAISNRGTVVGSLCHADPAAEIPAVWLAVGGKLSAQSPAGIRTVRAESFFDSNFTTTLKPDEVATEVRFDLATGTTGWSFEEIARRHGDFALAGVVIQLSLDGGSISDPRIVVFGVGATPVRLAGVETRIAGTSKLDDGLLDQVVADVTAELNPPGDIHATTEYRRHIAGVLVRRGIPRALEDAQSRV